MGLKYWKYMDQDTLDYICKRNNLDRFVITDICTSEKKGYHEIKVFEPKVYDKIVNKVNCYDYNEFKTLADISDSMHGYEAGTTASDLDAIRTYCENTIVIDDYNFVIKEIREMTSEMYTDIWRKYSSRVWRDHGYDADLADYLASKKTNTL